MVGVRLMSRLKNHPTIFLSLPPTVEGEGIEEVMWCLCNAPLHADPGIASNGKRPNSCSARVFKNPLAGNERVFCSQPEAEAAYPPYQPSDHLTISLAQNQRSHA